jgi:RNA polymerase sigma-70 factor (ECF subfamily)
MNEPTIRFVEHPYYIETEAEIENIRLRMMTDCDIMKLFCTGNMDAFDVLIERYKNSLMGYVYHYLHNYSMSQEIIKETFVRVQRKRNKIIKKNNVRIDLFSITRKLMNDTLWKRKRQHSITIKNNRIEPRETNRISDTYLSDLTSQMALDFLHPIARETIILRDILGLSYSDIAAITNSPIPKIKNLVHEARVKLCAYLL